MKPFPKPPVRSSLKNKQHLDIQIRNLMDVVHTNRGTAYGIGYNAPYKIAGKTGTAQVKSIAQGQSYSEKLTPERFRDHALFVSFAPVERPQGGGGRDRGKRRSRQLRGRAHRAQGHGPRDPGQSRPRRARRGAKPAIGER